MRAAIFQGVGNGLAIEERPDPVPGVGEVVLRVARCGVCGSDMSMTSDHAGAFCLKPGAMLGHECAGEVVALGSGVARLKLGDKVTALPSWGCGACPHTGRADLARAASSPSAGRFETVARHFDAGHVEPRLMVSGRVALEELPAAFERLRIARSHSKLMVGS